MPKLPNGMYRRGRAYYYRTQRNGKDTRVSLGTDYEAASRRFRDLKLGLTQVGHSGAGVTVEIAVKRWMETAVTASCIPSGQRDIASRVRRYVVPTIGDWVLDRVSPDDLLAFRSQLERLGYRPTLVRRILTDVRTFFRWAALEARLIPDPPIPRRLLPRLQESFPKRLTDEEVRRVSEIRDPYGFVIRFALASGLRWGELRRSRAEHAKGRLLMVEQTKSGRVRRVPLGDSILEELKGRRGPLVPFTHPGMFAKQVKKLSGVDRFHVHMTRHTFASRWVDAGGNLAVLQVVLGHSSIVVTQRYARLSDDAVLAEAMRIAGESGTESGTGASSARRKDSQVVVQQRMTR
jgi:integrase